MSTDTDWQPATLEWEAGPTPGARMPGYVILALVRTVSYSILTSMAVVVVAYSWKLNEIEHVIPRIGPFIVPAAVTYALLIATARQVRACGKFSCMAGMMIAMTLAMVAAFLTSFYVGATNGLFVGSVVGMVLGVGLGVWMGARAGVMAFLEAAMAGLMGGPMGAMTSVMLLYDHVRAMGAIVLVIAAAILGALSYMTVVENRDQGWKERDSDLATVLLSIILTTGTICLMVFGPVNGS
jgi:hypothetical protein